MNMAKYVRITKGLSDKGTLVTTDEFKEFIKTKKDTDYYYSTFYYNDQHYNHFKQTNTVKGITDVTGDTLYFDFDNENFEEVRKDTIELIERFKEENITDSNYKMFYSGKKGIHIQLKLDKEYTPKQLSYFALNYYGKNLRTLDSRIYNPARVLRLPYSKHQDTGIYKQILHEAQLRKLDINRIKIQFSKSCPIKDLTSVPIKVNETYLMEEPIKTIIKNNDSDESMMKEKPKHWLDYKWALLNAEGLRQGERDHSMMILAATCEGFGYNREITSSFLNYFDRQYAKVTEQDVNEEQVEAKLDVVFSEGWEGGTYSIRNDVWLQDYCRRIKIRAKSDKGDSVMRIGDIDEQFAEYIKHLEENTIKTGIRELDEAMPLTTGTNLGIVGAASSGKTALALNILKHTSQSGNISVMASLDMHRNRLFEKLLLKESSYSRKELYQAYKDGKMGDVIAKIKEDYKNVWFYDRSAPTVDDIRDYVERVQEETGKKVKLCMIDYFERVNSEKSDDTAASKEVASKIQDMLNDLDLCVITLVQPNKFSLSAGPDTPITSYTAIKGSSFLYQSFRSIISIWRPFFTPATRQRDLFLQMAILKNDLGEQNEFSFNWIGKTGEINEMNDEDREVLNAWLGEKRAQQLEGFDV